MKSERGRMEAPDMPQPEVAGREARVASMARMIRPLFAYHFRSWKHCQTGRAGTWGDSHMPRWDGGRDRFGKVHPSIWEAAARSCLEHGLDPAVLVEAVFDDFNMGLGLPRPNALVGRSALRRHRDYVADGPMMARMRWKAELGHLEAEAYSRKRLLDVSMGVAACGALASPHTQLCPLFRCCVARMWKVDELGKPFAEPALHTYLRRRDAHDRGWGVRIPPGLRAAADAILARWR